MAARSIIAILSFFASIAALSGAPARAADTPMSFAMLAFIAGEWRSAEGGGTGETLLAMPLFGASLLYVDVIADPQEEGSAAAYREVWIAGFDPATGKLYLDVYSAGGYRSVMDGVMVVPGKVWAFETSGGGSKERRVITKIDAGEIAIKYEFAAPGGALKSEERFYNRVELQIGYPSPAPGGGGDSNGGAEAGGEETPPEDESA